MIVDPLIVALVVALGVAALPAAKLLHWVLLIVGVGLVVVAAYLVAGGSLGFG